MAGHLFLVRGDLSALACDAVLVPSGWGYGGGGKWHVAPAHWTGLLGDRRDAAGYVAVDGPDDARCVLLGKDAAAAPEVWIGHTGEADQTPEWYGKAIADFVEQAGRELLPWRPLDDARPLLGIPLVGTGEGGLEAHKGEAVEAIVAAALAALEHRDADVALVLWSSEAFAAAQKARSRATGVWRELDEDLLAAADDLAAHARGGRLVPFVGAGASMGAGAPSWRELLGRLAGEAGVDARALWDLDSRDAGGVLARALGPDRLREAIVEQTSIARVSLVQQLLASLPVDESVTTNYDDGLERALRDAGRPPKVLPQERVAGAQRWLVHLHGSVNDDRRRIVLSRDDYLHFEGESSALAGIVQALLMTRHMLFVGYSLSDDNFHRLLHHVRATLGTAEDRLGSGPFATALTPHDVGLRRTVFEDDVHFVATDREGKQDVRRMAIVLDRAAAGAASPAAHFLDRTYDALFSEGERALRDALLACLRTARSDAVPKEVQDAVETALAPLGVGIAGRSCHGSPVRRDTLTMQIRVVGKGQQPIFDVKSWLEHGGPKKGEDHWRDGYSAKEFAKAWLRTGAPAVPAELAAVLPPADEVLVRAEHVTDLDGLGEGRNHDALLELRRDGAVVAVVGIEAKVAEGFSGPVSAHGSTKPGSRKTERCNLLSRALFGVDVLDPETSEVLDAQLATHGYQLWTAAVGTIIEAQRLGLDEAVLVVHHLGPVPSEDAEQLAAFAARLGPTTFATRHVAAGTRLRVVAVHPE
jgi:hypothetical protein